MSTRKRRRREEWIAELNAIVAKKRYSIVGDIPGTTEQLTLRCHNHEREAKTGDPRVSQGWYEWRPFVSAILRGSGCPYCRGLARITSESFAWMLRYTTFVLHPRTRLGYERRRRYTLRCTNCGKSSSKDAYAIQRRVGCEYCARTRSGIARRTTDDHLKKMLIAAGRTYIRHWYEDGILRVTYSCENGHESTKSGAHQLGCQYCGSLSLGEEKTRAILEHLTGEPWLKVRPSWLPGSKGQPLELDGYCGALKCAFEFQGPHHFEQVWKKSGSPRHRLKAVKARDQLKKQGLTAHGDKLLEIHWKEFESIEKLGGDNALGAWFAAFLRTLGIATPGANQPFQFKACTNRLSANTKVCHDLEEQHGIKFLDDACASRRHKCRWECPEHGVYEASIKQMLKLGSRSCKSCGATRRANARRQPLPSISQWRYECRKASVTCQYSYHRARQTGTFRIWMPSVPTGAVSLRWVQLFQKTSRHSKPWQYTDEHDAPADLKNHPNRNVVRLPSGKLKGEWNRHRGKVTGRGS